MIALYGHAFSSFTWKALIALHERNVPFRFMVVDPQHAENAEAMKELSPTGQFPALVDGERRVTGSNAVIGWCDLTGGDAPRMVPDDSREALEAREMADVFDDYVNAPMQRIVGNALRPEGERDPRGVRDAQSVLDRTYAWLEPRLAGKEWAACGRFTIADCAAAPALFYADWVREIPQECGNVRAYRARLLARSSVKRVVDEARPFRPYFPLGAPDRD